MDTVHATEIWRPIPDWPYEASSHGRVRRAAPGINTQTGRVMSPTVAGRGYRKVNLCRNGERRNFHVSVLVCLAFHGPKPSENHQVRHLNGDKTEDRATNLLWGTPQDNSDDRSRHGNVPMGENHYKARISADEVRAIRAEYDVVCRGRRGAPFGWRKSAAERFGTTPANIKHIVLRRSWCSVAPSVEVVLEDRPVRFAAQEA